MLSKEGLEKRMEELAQYRDRQAAKERARKNIVLKKVCKICYREKPATDFYKRSASKDSLDSSCRACRACPPRFNLVDFKSCKTCEETKDALEFYRSDRSADGLVAHCKDCQRLKRKAKREERSGPHQRASQAEVELINQQNKKRIKPSEWETHLNCESCFSKTWTKDGLCSGCRSLKAEK